MLNKEKYAKEIIQICVSGETFGITKDNEIFSCECGCSACRWFTGGGLEECMSARRKWANSESEKVFTEKEKQLIRLLDKVKYVARDEDGTLCFYQDKPGRDDEEWDGLIDHWFANNLTSLPFDAIKWEDEKPTSREEILGE